MAQQWKLAAEKLITGDDAILRLSQLGIPISAISQSILQALRERANCTHNDVRSGPGLIFWMSLVRNVRDNLRHASFRADCVDNLELTIRDDNKVALLICQGSSRTGTNKPPRTKRHRGPKTVEAVGADQRQLFLPGFGPERDASIDDREMWILLTHYSRRDNEVRCEVSLPCNVTEGTHIQFWTERILLPTMAFQNIVEPLHLPEGPSIDVPVSRRSA